MASSEPRDSFEETAGLPAVSVSTPASQLVLPLIPYGSGHFRLLRFLESGHPVWEAAPFDSNVLPEELSEDSLPTPPPDLRQFAEAFSLAVDTAQRLRSLITPSSLQEGSDGQNTYNPSSWIEAIAHRDSARRWLASLLVMIDLLLGTLSQPSKSPFLTLTPARHEIESIPVRASKNGQPDSAWSNSTNTATASHSMQSILVKHKELCIGIAGRCRILTPLINICMDMQTQLHHSMLLHKDFLTILSQLRPHWKLLRRRYAATDFTQNAGNYPYLAEIVVKFFSLPAIGWEIVDNVFLTWPPYPTCSPFIGQYAHLRFGTSNASCLADYCNDISTLQIERPIMQATHVTINFEGLPAHFIENKYQLVISIHPIDLKIISSSQEHSIYGKTNSQAAPVIPETIIHSIAKRVHLQLKAAQLSLIDRATFCVLSSHAQRLSSSAGEMDLESGDICDASATLDHSFKASNNKDAMKSDGFAASFPAESVCCIQSDCSELSFLVKGIKPIECKSKDLEIPTATTPVVNPSAQMSFPIDIVVRIAFIPSKSNSPHHISLDTPSLAEKSNVISSENCEQTNLISNIKHQTNFPRSEVHGVVSNHVLAALEDLALFKLRDMFLDAWKFRSVDLPRQCFDLHPAVFNSSVPQNPGGTILQRFLRWIVPYFRDIAFIP
ncbi:mediator complex subunit MED17 [Cardiosporidium cionae]|uniref:Mediator complex subunit MED17 n=1 Tax=Cardiosporidium cionae TaxID=476202 RepID=A0ABQ7J932_9APIC|nr:mediator complex subunit MED17 [Cardiosporidium cionae]|eukprot:KAF8820521.1 mediator complex subunit MED17 [Cardiosporidium cionae]